LQPAAEAASARRRTSTLHRFYAAAALEGLAAIAASHGVSAQQTATQPGWIFNVAPYNCLPTINATLSYNLPPQLGGRAPTDVSAGPGDCIPNLHFVVAFTADARYDWFSILIDCMYPSAATSASRVKAVDFLGLAPNLISRSANIGVSADLKTAIWTAAGGFSVTQGDWDNFGVIAGFRFLGVNANTDFNLAVTLTGPRGGNARFGGIGSLSGSQNIWNGIGGVRLRIRPGNAGLFIPYYFDVDTGGSKLTWQAVGGLGCQTGWDGISLT
jgi:hypothetical protein